MIPFAAPTRLTSYKTIGLGGIGWRSTASASTDQSNAKIDLTQGILIRRKQPANVTLRVFGSAKSGNTFIEVQSGLNILANVYPGGTLTLGNSHLYTGDPSTGLASGSNVTADKLLIYTEPRMRPTIIKRWASAARAGDPLPILRSTPQASLSQADQASWCSASPTGLLFLGGRATFLTALPAALRLAVKIH